MLLIALFGLKHECPTVDMEQVMNAMHLCKGMSKFSC